MAVGFCEPCGKVEIGETGCCGPTRRLVKSVIALLCICFAVAAEAKSGETVPDGTTSSPSISVLTPPHTSPTPSFLPSATPTPSSGLEFADGVVPSDAVTQFNIGAAYYRGDGGKPRDYVQAVKYFRKAAEQNYAGAQRLLGVCYYAGYGVAKDYKQAVKWFRKAAEQNDTSSQNDLGLLYAKAEGVAKDSEEAVKWFRIAAEQNFPAAQSNLGTAYLLGDGVAKDYSEAVTWFRKAAEQNDSQGQYNLSISYLRGEGVTKDYVESYKWGLLAASQNHEGAKQHIALLENVMTREQVAEGQRLARNFRPRQVPSVKTEK